MGSSDEHEFNRGIISGGKCRGWSVNVTDVTGSMEKSSLKIGR
jgi:hypothetical protein